MKVLFRTDIERQKWKIIAFIFLVYIDINLFHLMSKWLYGSPCIWAKFIRKTACSFWPRSFIIVFTKTLELLLRLLNQIRGVLYSVNIIFYLYPYVLKSSLSSGLPTTICEQFLTYTFFRVPPPFYYPNSIRYRLFMIYFCSRMCTVI
jgi:hypothetical protein